MRSFPRVHRRVLRTWLCLLFLLSIVFHDTGDASPTTAIIPFLSSIPLLLSYGATVFLVPDLVLSSSTPPPAPRRHPTPAPASHSVNPPQGRWLISFHTTFDDQTLYNIAIRRPLNGTGKLVTRKQVNWLASDEFVGASTTGEYNAVIESPIYGTPIALGLIGFPGLELGAQVEDLHPLGTLSDKGHGILTYFTDFKHEESCLTKFFIRRAHTDIAFHSDSDPIASVFNPTQLLAIPRFTKSSQLVVEPSRSEAPTRTWKEALERYGFAGLLALAAVAFLIFLTADAIESLIAKAVDKFHGAFVTTRLGVSEFCRGLCRRIAEFATRCLTAAGLIEPKFVPERLLTPKDSPRKADRWQLSPNRPRSGSIRLFPIPCSPQKKLASKSSETGLPLEEIIKALNERFDRRDRKPVGPPFLSPAWAKLHRPRKHHALGPRKALTEAGASRPTHRSDQFTRDPFRPALFDPTYPPKSGHFRPTLDATFDRAFRGPHALEEPGSPSLSKIELPPPEPRLVSSALSKEEGKHQSWDGNGSINPLWIPLPPVSDVESDFLKGYTSNVTADDQAKQEVALEVQAGLDTDTNRPVVPPPLHPLASSPITLETTPEVLGNPESVPVDEKTEKEDSSASMPSEPNGTGIVLSAQVSGPMPEAGLLGASKRESSFSVPLATVERLRAILCTDTSSSTSQPSKSHDSGAALSAQVSGSAPQTGFLGKLLEVEGTVASAKHSRTIARADIDGIEKNANRRGKSSVRRKGATVARLDTIAEDVSDSTVSSDAPTVGVAVSSFSIPPLATTNTPIEPPADPHAQDAGEPRNHHDSGVSPSAQVSGMALEAGFLGTSRSRRLEVEAAVPSARQSRMIIQANLDRVEKGNERQRSSGRRKGATLARREAYCLDSIAEDLEDSTVSSNTAPIATSSSSSISTPATTDTAAEPPTNAEDHPLRETRAAEDTVEKKPKKVVTFSDEVQVQDLPMSKWDWEARRKFHSEAKEREIEDEYRVWAKGKQLAEGYRRLTTSAMKSVGGGPRSFFDDDDDDDDVDEEGFSKSEQEEAKEESKRSGESVFDGASTSRDGARSLSEDEWSRLEEYQGVRSNPAAKEVVRPQPETAPMDVDDVVFKFEFTCMPRLEPPPPSLPPPVRMTPVPMPRRIQARINARPSATSIQRARRRAAFRP